MDTNDTAAVVSAIPQVVSSVSEVVRERETYRYDDLSWTSAALNDPHDPIAPDTLVSAVDPSLTSYAQLGVFRLNANRALISLFDRDRQHVIAEALRNSPIAPSELACPDPDPNDGDDYFQHDHNTGADGEGFWLCGTAIPRSCGICEHVLLAERCGNNPDQLPVSFVPDLAADPRFQDAPYLHGRPLNRFYAGIPIRSPGPNGINIGVYCVFGTTPRLQPLSNDEVRFMQDISRTVMSYLDCRRSLERFRRSERMVRGMGNFVEGSDSLILPATAPGRGSSHSRKSSSRSVDRADAADSRTAKQLSIRQKKPEALSKNIGGGIHRFDEALLSPRTPNPPTPLTPFNIKTSSPSLEPTPSTWFPGHFQSQSGSILIPDHSSRCSTPRPESQQSEERSPRPVTVSQVSTADLKLVETGQVFAKAANIIRQSLDVDGVLFLDATVRSFGGLVGPQNERKVSAVGLEDITYLSNDEDSTREAPQDNFCPVLGFATPTQSSIQGSRVPTQYEGLPDKTLQKLLRRYPSGRVLNFETNGQVLLLSGPSTERPQPSSSMPPRRPVSPIREWSRDSHLSETLEAEAGNRLAAIPQIRKQRVSVAESIIHLFPEARSVAVIPLWDRQKKRWVAGGFAWTKDPTRTFTSKGTISFLRVFGMIAMAEIYRLDTKAEETMKSNILGSISHELRSPLHGLVGAVELLNDSKLDAVQQNVLSIIETSGKTLVDTINHLLDYSKINSVIENDKKENNSMGKLGTEMHAQAKARTPPVELDCLVEEVVESVLHGYSHERQAATNYKTSVDAVGGQMRLPGHADRVQIYLDIEPAVSWRYPTHPGAFRRIVMNLFGNSLKFTTFGFIKISLAQDPASRAVLLTVADSGKGISEEYLQDRLFTPFCQEDQFAPGTGLGLSLVRQIAVNLGGEVKVASQIGRGTTITVSLPFSDINYEPQPGGPSDTRNDMNRMRGKKVRIRGFEGVALLESDLSANGPMTVGRLANTEAHALAKTCRDWLQMEVLSEADEQQPDVIIHYDSGLSFEAGKAIGMMATCPVLFVCEPSVAMRNFSTSFPNAASRIRTFEFFSRPLGPRKLANGLVHLLEVWKVKQEQNAVSNKTNAASVGMVAANTDSRTMIQMVDDSNDEFRALQSAQTSAEAMKAVQQMKSALPTPPEDPPSKDPMTRPEPLGSEVLDGDSVAAVPAVLIVDDNAINLKILSAYMDKLKRRYVTAVNGLESSTMYAQGPSAYCCILTDISMPTMDGLESARRIRQHERIHRLKQTPIIALTGLAGVDVQEDAVASGVDMFLTRPVTLKRLTEALEAVGLR